MAATLLVETESVQERSPTHVGQAFVILNAATQQHRAANCLLLGSRKQQLPVRRVDARTSE